MIELKLRDERYLFKGREEKFVSRVKQDVKSHVNSPSLLRAKQLNQCLKSIDKYP